MSCSGLTSIVGGTGPVYTNTSGTYTATYTCYSGYTMIGSADLTCGASGTWSTNPPECINDKYYNNLNINDSGIPTWLAIVLGVVAGIAALLLLTCLLICCLRLCGCLPGSFFGGGSHIYPDDGGGYSGFCYCCRSREPTRRRRHGRLSRGRGYDSRRSSLIDIEDGPYVVSSDQPKYKNRDYRRNGDNMYQEAYLSNGRPPVQHKNKLNQTLVRSNVVHTSVDSGISSNKTGDYFANGDVNGKEINKRPAKEIKQWMPHTNPIRDINTSTK